MEEFSPITSLWHGILMGGPFVVAVHLLMLFSFCLSLVLSFRNAGTGVAFACAIAPFVCGATAMWIAIVGLTVALSSMMYEGGAPTALRGAQFPFLLGTALSTIAFVVYLFARARTFKAGKH